MLINELGPVQIYVLRFLLAYFVVLCICHKRLFASTLTDELLMMLCGLTSGSLYFIAENTALQYTLATNVSLLTSMSPLITAIVLGLFYKNETLGIGTWIGSVLAVMGVVCVVFKWEGRRLRLRCPGKVVVPIEAGEVARPTVRKVD